MTESARAVTQPDPIGGIVAMTAAMGCFIVSDVMCKLAAQRGLPVGEVIALRGLFSALLLIAAVRGSDTLALLREQFDAAWATRVAGEMVAAAGFVSALVHLPLANVVTITQTIPLALTAAGAVFLGEFVGWRRWCATVAGFIGVLLIVMPGTAAFSWWSLGALLCVVAVTVRDLATRHMGSGIPVALVTLTTAVGVAMIGGLMGLIQGGWIMPDLKAVLALAAAAVAISGGYYFSIVAVQRANLSTIAPFRYTIVPMSLVLGYAIWGDIPDLLALVGIAVIVAAGIYTFIRLENAGARPAR